MTNDLAALRTGRKVKGAIVCLKFFAADALELQGDLHDLEPCSLMHCSLNKRGEGKIQTLGHNAGHGTHVHAQERQPLAVVPGKLLCGYIEHALGQGQFVHGFSPFPNCSHLSQIHGKKIHVCQAKACLFKGKFGKKAFLPADSFYTAAGTKRQRTGLFSLSAHPQGFTIAHFFVKHFRQAHTQAAPPFPHRPCCPCLCRIQALHACATGLSHMPAIFRQ